MFFRLWTRAPWTAMVVRAARLEAVFIGRVEREERQFLKQDVAALREPHGSRRLSDSVLVCQVLAGGGHAADVEVAAEVMFQLARRPRLAGFAQVIEHGRER